MSNIPIMRKINKGAFRGPLNCPLCNQDCTKRSRFKFVEKVTPTRIRYRCVDCGRTLQYDFSNNADFLTKHPYAPFKRSRFNDIIERWKPKPII